jgi:hypothetical protein
MKFDASLQLSFGIIATILTLSGLCFKLRAFRSIKRQFNDAIHANDRPAACLRRRVRIEPLLPLNVNHISQANRRSMYLMELNLTQNWIGQHAAGWSVGQPRMHRIADA